jgi:hypothetical protein
MIFHKVLRPTQLLWVLTAALAWLVACQPTTAEPTTAPIVLPTAAPTTEAIPTPTTMPPSTAIPETVETAVWLIRPQGIQCEPVQYANLSEAVAELEALKIEILASAEEDIPQVQACGYSTSTHYKVQINTADKATAEQLGWYEEGTVPPVNPADT